jgi:hypothetical protein
MFTYTVLLKLEQRTLHCTQTVAEVLDEIQTKVLRVFLLAIHSHLHSFALRWLFLRTHTTSYVLRISTAQLLSNVKKKEGNLEENHTPFPKKSIKKPQV